MRRGNPGRPLPHPALAEAHRTLQHRYGARFDGFGMIQYRDGRDGQAFHRDTDMKWLDDTVIAILSLGARRPWLLRPRANRYDHSDTARRHPRPGAGLGRPAGHGRPFASRLGALGAVPARPADGPRISVQWRYTSRLGRPFVGSSYRAPLNYSHKR